MEQNNFNGIHIMSEAVIMGGITVFLYKKISDLESTIEELKAQVTMQNSQIKFLLGSMQPAVTTPLIQKPQKEFFQRPGTDHLNVEAMRRGRQEPILNPQSQPILNPQSQPILKQASPSSQPEPRMKCEGSVCQLVLPPSSQIEKKVAISKISKQIEYDRENVDLDLTTKVNTFTNSSPNPVLKSVTPKPSLSVTDDQNGANELQKILMDIDGEEN